MILQRLPMFAVLSPWIIVVYGEYSKLPLIIEFSTDTIVELMRSGLGWHLLCRKECHDTLTRYTLCILKLYVLSRRYMLKIIIFFATQNVQRQNFIYHSIYLQHTRELDLRNLLPLKAWKRSSFARKSVFICGIAAVTPVCCVTIWSFINFMKCCPCVRWSYIPKKKKKMVTLT